MSDDHLPLPDDLHYLPADWLDESAPPPQAHPDAFIHREGNRCFLRPVEDEDDEESSLTRSLSPGDIVSFCEHRHFGSFTLFIDADGSGQVDGDYPDYANCFALSGDFETFAHSIPELIQNAEAVRDSACDIEIWWWSETSTPWLFAVDADGARFVKFVGVA